jgi:hypothetical protein
MAKLGLAIHEFGGEVSSPSLALHHGQSAERHHLRGRDQRPRSPGVGEHRTAAVPDFTKRYGLKRLVYAEPHETMPSAIIREKNIKSWPAGVPNPANHDRQSQLGRPLRDHPAITE